jgi:hypothetical protein
MTYESSKQLLTTYTGNRSPTNPFAVVVAGGFCGIASWALIVRSYPLTQLVLAKQLIFSSIRSIRQRVYTNGTA